MNANQQSFNKLASSLAPVALIMSDNFRTNPLSSTSEAILKTFIQSTVYGLDMGVSQEFPQFGSPIIPPYAPLGAPHCGPNYRFGFAPQGHPVIEANPATINFGQIVTDWVFLGVVDFILTFNLKIDKWVEEGVFDNRLEEGTFWLEIILTLGSKLLEKHLEMLQKEPEKAQSNTNQQGGWCQNSNGNSFQTNVGDSFTGRQTGFPPPPHSPEAMAKAFEEANQMAKQSATPPPPYPTSKSKKKTV